MLLKLFVVIVITISVVDCRTTRHTLEQSLSIRSKAVFGERARLITSPNEIPPHLRPATKACGMMLTKSTFSLVSSPFYGYRHTVFRPSETCFVPYLGATCHSFCRSSPEHSLLIAQNAFCSGFLVSPNQFVTAGHCIEGRSCSDIAILFDFTTWGPNLHFSLYRDNKGPFYVEPTKDVYWCKKILFKSYIEDDYSKIINGKRVYYSNSDDHPWRDAAVIELDRDVSDEHEWVSVQSPLNKDGSSYFTSELIGSKVVNVAHPVGLVELYDDDGVINHVHKYNMHASVDVEGGSSGSIIVNKENGKAIGILTRGRTDADMLVEQEEPGSSPICWARSHKGVCLDAVGHDAPNSPECKLKDMNESSVIVTTVQFYNHIDKNPIKFPILSMAANVRGAPRNKALQKLLGYIKHDGVWDHDFNSFLISKLKETKNVDGSPLFCTYCTIIDSPYNILTSIHPAALSKWLPIIGPNIVSDSTITSPGYMPSSGSAILALRELLKNGHTEYDYVSLEGDTWDDDLTKAVRSFSISRGYQSASQVDISLWRHLWWTTTEWVYLFNILFS